MRQIYKIEKYRLPKLLINNISEDDINSFFLENPFSFLYIYDSENLYAILQRDDLPFKGITCQHNFYSKFVMRITKNTITEEEAYNYFQENPSLHRFTVINQNKLICEFNDGAEPKIPYDIRKEIVSLRHLQLFTNEIITLFNERGWKKVLCIIHKKNEIYLKDIICNYDIICTEMPIYDKMELVKYDVIFDFILGTKMRRILMKTSRIVKLRKLIAPLALDRLREKCHFFNTNLLLLQPQSYSNISRLSKMEKNTYQLGKNWTELINDDDYIRKYSPTNEEHFYIKSGNFYFSHTIDNGNVLIQSNCSSFYVNVTNGLRRTIPYEDKDSSQKNIYIYGVCTAFGMWTPDSKTIASFIQQARLCIDNNIKVFNYGIMDGKNICNSILTALNQNIQNGDIVIIIDDIADIGDVNDVIDISQWINDEKRSEDIYFLDFPPHCNSSANIVIAQKIVEKIQRFYDKR